MSTSQVTTNSAIGLDRAGLAMNGGPTETIALTSTSAAVDQIPPADCSPTEDQRGQPRPFPAVGNVQ
jgi:hypothetical protein